VVHVDATSIAGLVGMDSVQVMPSGVSLRMSQAEKDTAVGSCQVPTAACVRGAAWVSVCRVKQPFVNLPEKINRIAGPGCAPPLAA
jgi:hypothetical protein